MQQPCKQCGISFEITEDDLEFLKRVSPVTGGKTLLLPPPTHCPVCRMQRRFAQRNERFLFRRTCDLTGKNIVSFYRPESPFKVYDKDAWWSDQWDGMTYGRSFDFTQPFFRQFAALRKDVPRLGMMATQAEGDAYSAYCVSTKNCYMCVSCVVSEDCYYCYQTNDSRNCTDCTTVTQCELCGECLYCHKLFSSAFCKDCENGSSLLFCEDCRGCSDCIGCKNLVNKKCCILNKQASPEEVAAVRNALRSHVERQKFEGKFRALALSLPTRATHLIQCENCTGDHLRQCKKCAFCFDSTNLEDCRHVFPTPPAGARDCRDIHYSPGGELLYDSLSAVRTYGARFVLHTWDTVDATYTDECFSCKHLFGCVGLKHKEYCVLNKQYTEGEYENLLPKVIEHMRKTPLRSSLLRQGYEGQAGASAGQAGEWGEFFPIADSPFGYNESIAQDELPLSKQTIIEKGWKWEETHDDLPQVSKVIGASKLPDELSDTPDDILNWAIECEATKRPFRIIKQELDFYRKMKLPIPHFHPDERHKRRMALRNPRKLWKRNCMKCGKDMQTTYSPERSEIVFCEECYLKEVY